MSQNDLANSIRNPLRQSSLNQQGLSQSQILNQQQAQGQQQNLASSQIIVPHQLVEEDSARIRVMELALPEGLMNAPHLHATVFERYPQEKKYLEDFIDTWTNVYLFDKDQKVITDWAGPVVTAVITTPYTSVSSFKNANQLTTNQSLPIVWEASNLVGARAIAPSKILVNPDTTETRKILKPTGELHWQYGLARQKFEANSQELQSLLLYLRVKNSEGAEWLRKHIRANATLLFTQVDAQVRSNWTAGDAVANRQDTGTYAARLLYKGLIDSVSGTAILRNQYLRKFMDDVALVEENPLDLKECSNAYEHLEKINLTGDEGDGTGKKMKSSLFGGVIGSKRDKTKTQQGQSVPRSYATGILDAQNQMQVITPGFMRPAPATSNSSSAYKEVQELSAKLLNYVGNGEDRAKVKAHTGSALFHNTKRFNNAINSVKDNLKGVTLKRHLKFVTGFCNYGSLLDKISAATKDDTIKSCEVQIDPSLHYDDLFVDMSKLINKEAGDVRKVFTWNGFNLVSKEFSERFTPVHLKRKGVSLYERTETKKDGRHILINPDYNKSYNENFQDVIERFVSSFDGDQNGPQWAALPNVKVKVNFSDPNIAVKISAYICLYNARDPSTWRCEVLNDGFMNFDHKKRGFTSRKKKEYGKFINTPNSAKGSFSVTENLGLLNLLEGQIVMREKQDFSIFVVPVVQLFVPTKPGPGADKPGVVPGTIAPVLKEDEFPKMKVKLSYRSRVYELSTSEDGKRGVHVLQHLLDLKKETFKKGKQIQKNKKNLGLRGKRYGASRRSVRA